MTDLWPEGIAEPVTTSPVRFIREQAALLGQKTGNTVTAKVSRSEEGAYWQSGAAFIYRFYIIAPTLDYRFQLFQLAFPIEMYPVTIKPDDDIMEELNNANLNTEFGPYGTIRVDSEEQLIPLLASILGSAKSRKIVQSLVAQSKEA